MDSSETFVWSDAFLLGYPQMDETHREFVETVNAMLTVPDEAFALALDAFAEHAERHFGEEAEWMHASDFPALQCHIDEHDAVMKSVREVQDLVASDPRNGVKTGRRLARELVRWFPGHADYLDSALSHWMTKKTHGGAPVVLRRRAAARD